MDLVLLMLDATKSDVQGQLMEQELALVGIRINQSPPNVCYKPKKNGGVSFNATLPLTHLNAKLCIAILRDRSVHSADLLVREDVTVDQFLDVVEGNRQYLKRLYVYNHESVSLEELDRLAWQSNTVVVSCESTLNFDALINHIWTTLTRCRVFTKKRGAAPDFGDPLVLREGARVEDACHTI